MNTRTLLERRAAIVTEMRGITNSPSGSAGDLSAEQSSKFDTLKGELEGLESRIARQQVLDDAERRMSGQPLRPGPGITGSTLNCASSAYGVRSVRRFPIYATRWIAGARSSFHPRSRSARDTRSKASPCRCRFSKSSSARFSPRPSRRIPEAATSSAPTCVPIY